MQLSLWRGAIGRPLEKVNVSEDFMQQLKHPHFQQLPVMRLLHTAPPASRPDLDDRYIVEKTGIAPSPSDSHKTTIYALRRIHDRLSKQCVSHLVPILCPTS